MEYFFVAFSTHVQTLYFCAFFCCSWNVKKYSAGAKNDNQCIIETEMCMWVNDSFVGIVFVILSHFNDWLKWFCTNCCLLGWIQVSVQMEYLVLSLNPHIKLTLFLVHSLFSEMCKIFVMELEEDLQCSIVKLLWVNNCLLLCCCDSYAITFQWLVSTDTWGNFANGSILCQQAHCVGKSQ
jgi:hypothetical protein